MAHLARLNELAESLIAATTGLRKGDGQFKTTRDRTVRGLRDQSYARTNQFAIKDRYDGLVEKLVVRNREDLSEALQSRLDELPARSKWLPEILALFLELSDRPVEKSDLGRLEDLARPLSDAPQLTWQEIIADDPLEGDELWDDVERGYHSSGDEGTVDGAESEPTTSTDATSIDGDVEGLARHHLRLVDPSTLDEIKATTQGGSELPSELTLIRETFSMLRGLPTTLFDLDNVSGAVYMKPDVRCATTAESTVQDLCQQVTSLGKTLNFLRQWVHREQNVPFLRSVQSAVQRYLQTFAAQLGSIEQGYVTPQGETVVSAIDIRTHIENLTRPLAHLANSIRSSEGSPGQIQSPFGILDALYNEACVTQMAGDDAVFSCVVEVLLAGFRTYLKPVKSWLETGAIPPSASDFVVDEADANCELGQVWHEKWSLRTLAGGEPSMPRFMHPYAQDVFARGKARAFYRLLDPTVDIECHMGRSQRTDFDAFEDLQSGPELGGLLPFSRLFEDALADWLRSRTSDGTIAMKTRLLHDHGVLKSLSGLSFAYFAADGVVFQAFADTVYERTRRRPSSWKDCFMLTELAQSTFDGAGALDRRALSVDVLAHDQYSSTARSVTRQMEDVKIRMALSWPVQNITRSSDLPVHSAAFAFLLQTYYALALLRPELFTLRTLDSRSRALPIEHQAALTLRWKLSWLVNVLYNHITSTAANLHANMLLEMEAVEGIDSMTAVWSAYAARLEMALLLARNLTPIKDAIVNILELCERFAAAWRELFPHLPLSESTRSVAPGPSPQADATSPGKLLNELEKNLSFIKAGLRSVSRAGGESAIEALVDKIEVDAG